MVKSHFNIADERHWKIEQSNQGRETLLANCRYGLSELRNLKYPRFIFIGRHDDKIYSFDEGQTFVKAKGQEKQPIDPNAIPLENFSDYAPGSPLLPALASIINDTQVRAQAKGDTSAE